MDMVDGGIDRNSRVQMSDLPVPAQPVDATQALNLSAGDLGRFDHSGHHSRQEPFENASGVGPVGTQVGILFVSRVRDPSLEQPVDD
jgi:hypothetical protein